MENAPSGRPETDAVELRMLAQRAGITLTDDELAAALTTHQANRQGLDRLRAALALEEEPAHVFIQQVGQQVGRPRR